MSDDALARRPGGGGSRRDAPHRSIADDFDDSTTDEDEERVERAGPRGWADEGEGEGEPARRRAGGAAGAAASDDDDDDDAPAPPPKPRTAQWTVHDESDDPARRASGAGGIAADFDEPSPTKPRWSEDARGGGDDANASASANANARARRAAAATTYDDDDDDEVSSSEDEGRDGRLSYAPRYNPNRARGRVQTKEELDAAAPKRAHDLGRRGVDGGVTFEDDGVDLSVLTSRLLTREECEEVRRVESVSSPSAPRARLDLSILHVIEHSRFLTNRIPPRRRISTRCGPRTRSGRSSCRCFRRVLYTGPHTTPSAW